MKKEFRIGNRDFTFEYEENVDVQCSLMEENGGISLYRIFFDWGASVSPKPIKLNYSVPCADMYYCWDPIEKKRAIPFGNQQITESRLGCGMPLKGLLSKKGINAHLIALSDVKSPLALRMMTTGFSQGYIHVGVDFFTSLTGPFEAYEAVLRVDERRLRFDDAVYGAREWFESLGYKTSHIPDDTKVPMYSTWYSYGQGVTAEDVVKECEMAARLGMKAVILDDGWQTENYNETYGFCGDWRPVGRKFPDMRGLSDKIHALGMKLIIWYSVPFVGIYSDCCRQFEGAYLRYFENTNCYALDPRYKRVRDYLINTYTTAVREWNLDGLKLDFIDRFKTNGEYNEAMDFVSVEEATHQLLKDINRALKEINPEILIEFRQPYFGPVVNAYGNMMRVWDCPLDGCMNKNQTVNLRLVSGECAVHSDMIYWHKSDSPESVALQLYGTVFSVPQISARLGEITKEQGRALQRYLDFWNTHRDTLMGGRLRVDFEENGYGYVETLGKGERVAMLSSTPVFELDDRADRSCAINLTCGDRVVLRNPLGRNACYEAYDCLGERADGGNASERVTDVSCPTGGMVVVKIQR